MVERGRFRSSATRPGFETVAVNPPDPGLNRRYYERVGSQWEWVDRLSWSSDDWQRYLDRGSVKTFVGKVDGGEVGYFELEVQGCGNVEIVYFGLLPEWIGAGLGGALLSAAVERAWGLPATERVWLHTCTKDHPHALDNYRARGFELFRTEHDSAEGPSSA